MEVSRDSQIQETVDQAKNEGSNRLRYKRKSNTPPCERFDVEAEFPDSPMGKRYIERSAATLELAE